MSTGCSPASTRWAWARLRACSRSTRATGDWDAARMATFDALIAPRGLGWTLRDILPGVLPAGRPAGRLTPEGARLIDPSGSAPGRHPTVPARGRRRHGHGRHERGPPTIGQRLGGHLDVRDDRAGQGPGPGPRRDRHRGHARRHARGHGPREQRVVRPRRLDRPLRPGRRGHGRRSAASTTSTRRLLPLAVQGEPDAGGLLSINYVSGEHVTGFTEGRPLFARSAGQPVQPGESHPGDVSSRRSAPCGRAWTS